MTETELRTKSTGEGGAESTDHCAEDGGTDGLPQVKTEFSTEKTEWHDTDVHVQGPPEKKGIED